MAKARWELSQVEHFDFYITNDDLECSVQTMSSIYTSLRHRVGR